MEQVNTLEARLRAVETRFDEIQSRLAELGGSYDPDESKRLAKERASLEPLVDAWRRHRALAEQLSEAEAMVRDSDSDMSEMAKAEAHLLRESLDQSETRLRELLIPRDPN